MPETVSYQQAIEVEKGDTVEIATQGRKHVGKVLSHDRVHCWIDGKNVGYQYGLEISNEDGTGYQMYWKQWMPREGGKFRIIKRANKQ